MSVISKEKYNYIHHDNKDKQQQTIVGSGYDVITGTYINPLHAKVTNPIVDMNDVEKVAFKKSNITKSDVWATEGSTVREAMMDFNARLEVDVNFFMFSGGIEAEFGLQNKNQHEYSYFRIISKFINQQQYLQGDVYKNYLTKEFKNDLYHMENIDKLFSKYGTHMIKSAFLGGRMTFNFTYHKDSSETQEKISGKVSAAYKEIIKSKATSEYSRETKQVVSNSDITVRTVGGKHYDMQSLDLFSRNYSKWLDSIEDNSVWAPCDIANMDNMIPIWEFCDDKLRAAKLEHRYYELLFIQTEKLSPKNIHISNDIFIANGKNDFEARKLCPTGYAMIYKDLHEEIDNQFTYICYKQTTVFYDFCMALTTAYSETNNMLGKKMSLTYNNSVYGFTVLGIINSFTEGKKTLYVYLLGAKYSDNRGARPIFLTGVDVLYDDASLPKDYKYVGNALNYIEKENCNKGKDVAPSYIINKYQS